jgi:hypothetical protein
MEEGTLRANVIEAKIDNVSVRYSRMKVGGSLSGSKQWQLHNDGVTDVLQLGSNYCSRQAMTMAVKHKNVDFYQREELSLLKLHTHQSI